MMKMTKDANARCASARCVERVRSVSFLWRGDNICLDGWFDYLSLRSIAKASVGKIVI